MSAKKRSLIIGSAAILLIALFIVTYIYSTKNSFHIMQQGIQAAWAQVENQLQRRYDLIPNLVETVKGYAKQEREVLIEVTNARAKVGGASNIPDKIAANNELAGALSRLLVVIERYPDLKSNQNFLRLQDELAGTENRIAVERMRYNEAVKKYNTAIGLVPKSLIAAMFKYYPAAYFETPKDAQTTPQVKF